ncbi:MAG: histidine kinase dimerization/phosphoacceptor domain -containing protein [Spirochaetia bacterium]
MHTSDADTSDVDSSEPAQGDGAADGRDVRILIVEDEELVAENVRERVEGLGYVVTGTASTGAEAVRLAVATSPDVVLMDIRLEGEMDGVDAAARFGQYVDCAVLYLTSYTDHATVMRARETLPYGYIVKPVSTEELWSNIEVALYKAGKDSATKRSESFNRKVVSDVLDGILVLDAAESRIISANSVAVRLARGSAGDVVDTPVSEVLPREVAASLLSETPPADGETVALGAEFPPDGDGRVRYVDVESRSLRWEGELFVLITLRDVTPHVERQTEIERQVEERDELLREVHHRIKNNLQILWSLFDLQKRRGPPVQVVEALTKAQNRIRALSRVHEVLHREDRLRQVDIGRYLQTIVLELREAYSLTGLSVDVDAPGVFMRMERALPIGLAVTELVSNALKHAFGGASPEPPRAAHESGTQQAPHIWVTLRRREDHYELSVRDNGRGIGGVARSLREVPGRSLGLRIVEIVARQLRGHAELAGNGTTTVSIIFPVSGGDKE